MQQDKKNATKMLVGAIVVFALVLVVLVVLLVATPKPQIASISAQAEIEAEQRALEEAEKDGYYDTDPIEVVDLTELVGADLDGALELIGHGAEIDGEPTLVAGGYTEVAILLGEESATIDTGTAFVHLYLDKGGRVAQASYQININDLSCASLPFDRIVDEAHLVERLLEGAGLTSFQPDPVRAPAKDAYAHYDSSGKTITEERYQFVGTGGDAKGQQLEWGVLLDYDYEQAIEANNLAKTVRTVRVSVNALDS